MQYALGSKRNDDEKNEETTHARFSRCPFCATEYPMSREESLGETYMLCKNCGRKWRIICTLGTIWFLRTNDPQQEKRYTGTWILQRGDRSLEGICPYVLLETNHSKIGRQKVVEQGLDRFVWKDQPLLEYFDRYDALIKGHSCERIRIAFACARMRTKEEKGATTGSALSIKQVAAITNLSEQEASNCTQRLLDEGSISYEVRPEKGLTGTEAVIMGFLGELLYQMNEYTAEKIIKKLIR